MVSLFVSSIDISQQLTVPIKYMLLIILNFYVEKEGLDATNCQSLIKWKQEKTEKTQNREYTFQ